MIEAEVQDDLERVPAPDCVICHCAVHNQGNEKTASLMRGMIVSALLSTQYCSILFKITHPSSGRMLAKECVTRSGIVVLLEHAELLTRTALCISRRAFRIVVSAKCMFQVSDGSSTTYSTGDISPARRRSR